MFIIKIHEGRLSAVIGDNKVIVYDFEKLLNGATRTTSTILIHDEDTAPIHYHYLRFKLVHIEILSSTVFLQVQFSFASSWG